VTSLRLDLYGIHSRPLCRPDVERLAHCTAMARIGQHGIPMPRREEDVHTAIASSSPLIAANSGVR
jgi:hypothetical protein